MATSNSNNNEWLQIYQNNLVTGQSQPVRFGWSGDVVTDATTVTTTTSTTASSGNNQLGRVIRPNNPRRRSRASRRTPTTLLNTDTSNFRAMVQQFTGGGNGSNAFASAPTSMNSYNTDSPGLSYHGTGSRITAPPLGGYSVELRPPLHQQYYSAGGDHQYGFVQSVQEGGMGNFSGDNNNFGNDSMF
ncbi:VQ motif-containing protein 22 [Artemisia annua]|uniref:VQ motif-containing protein 22 n=1 Tax=Artemisia annua TaxID=35608 RepID=A0A2U1KYJ2_ARTAN|nr:VQ motif-containing protein 22 [Artemisia annua]